jgi:NAD-specific glutamate dehydrogenase
MTGATPGVVADAGVTFFPEVIEATGASVTAIVSAYLKAQQLARAREVRSSLEELRATHALPSLSKSWIALDAGARKVATWWLSARGRIPTDAQLEEMAKSVDQVYDAQASAVRDRNAEQARALEAQGIPAAVASRVLKAQYLNTTLIILEDAKRAGVDVHEMTVRHLAAGQASRIQDILDDLLRRPATGHWEPIAFRIVFGRLTQVLREIVLELKPPAGSSSSVDKLVPALEAGPLKGVRDAISEFVELEPQPSLSALMVLEERLSAMRQQLGA